MFSALRERLHVIECGVLVVERRGTVHAASPAVAQSSEFDLSLLLGGKQAPRAALDAAWGP
jgi:hypothetical protein